MGLSRAKGGQTTGGWILALFSSNLRAMASNLRAAVAFGFFFFWPRSTGEDAETRHRPLRECFAGEPAVSLQGEYSPAYVTAQGGTYRICWASQSFAEEGQGCDVMPASFKRCEKLCSCAFRVPSSMFVRK